MCFIRVRTVYEKNGSDPVPDCTSTSKILLYATRREFITHKQQRTTNWCHSHGLPSDRGGLHLPIWSTVGYPDRMLIRSRTRIDSNSNKQCYVYFSSVSLFWTEIRRCHCHVLEEQSAQQPNIKVYCNVVKLTNSGCTVSHTSCCASRWICVSPMRTTSGSFSRASAINRLCCNTIFCDRSTLKILQNSITLYQNTTHSHSISQSVHNSP